MAARRRYLPSLRERLLLGRRERRRVLRASGGLRRTIRLRCLLRRLCGLLRAGLRGLVSLRLLGRRLLQRPIAMRDGCARLRLIIARTAHRLRALRHRAAPAEHHARHGRRRRRRRRRGLCQSHPTHLPSHPFPPL